MSAMAIVLGKAGFVLFTLGLLIGIAIPAVRNSRMGLSAHLTAVQTGTALIAFALFWQYLAVPDSWSSPLILGLIASSYLLVSGILLAAIFPASDALPMAGKGYRGTPSQERIVSIVVKGSSVIMALDCLAITWFAVSNMSGTTS